MSTYKWFTFITEGLLKTIEEESSVLWETGDKPTQCKPTKKLLLLDHDGKLTSTTRLLSDGPAHHAVSNDDFVMYCKELKPKSNDSELCSELVTKAISKVEDIFSDLLDELKRKELK